MRTRLRRVVLVLVALVGGSVLSWSPALPAGTAAAAPTGDGSAWSSATIYLANGGIAYDHGRDQLLVAVSPSVPTLGNRLVEMDPHTGALGRSVAVGSTPGMVAVADDASRAYVALHGSPVVVEVDLETFTVSRRIDLGTIYNGPRYAQDLAVQPGHPGVIAVSIREDWDYGVAIFDEGTERPNHTPPGSFGVRRFAWSDDPGVIYGIYETSTDHVPISRLTVDGDGVSIASTDLAFPGFGFDIEFADGLLHSTSGYSVDPATMKVVGSYTSSGAIEVDAGQHKLFILSATTLTRVDIATQQSDWTHSQPGLAPRELVDAGDLLAAATADLVMLIGPGSSDDGFVLPPAAPPLLQTWNVRHSDVPVSRIASSPDGSHVYGVVRAGAASHPNEVVEVDVQTGALGRSLVVGSDPHRIAVSDDGSTLMVGHLAANTMTEVDVATFTVRRTIALSDKERVVDVAARPGAAHSFAAVLRNQCCASSGEGTVLVQEGVIAPKRAPRFGGPETIAFAGDPARLYGFDGAPSNLYTMSVDDDGLTIVSVLRSLVETSVGRVTGSAGRLYTASRNVVDPVIPRLIGTVGTVETLGFGGVVVPVPSVDRLFVLNQGRIAEYELESQVPVALHSGANASDALIAGSELVSATGTAIVFVPIGPDTRTLPGPPTNVHGAPGAGQVAVSWDPPAEDGNSPITNFRVVSTPGGATCQTSATACVITGLTNSVAYTFRVEATNVIGTGALSAAGGPVVPTRCDAAGSGPFTDVGPDHPFCADIEWMNAHGIAYGYPDGTFRAPAALSRQAIAVFVDRAAGESGSWPTTPMFTDVQPGDPFFADIQLVASHDLMHGYPDGTFRPTTVVSRQALAAILYRRAGSPAFAPPAAPTFSDVTASHPFFTEIEWLAHEHIAQGFGDGTFRATSPVTRQASAAFFHRAARD